MQVIFTFFLILIVQLIILINTIIPNKSNAVNAIVITIPPLILKSNGLLVLS